MTDIAALVASAEIALYEIAKQAYNLGMNLQNAAPGGEAREGNKSVSYLFKVAEKLHDFSHHCKRLVGAKPLDQAEKLAVIMQYAVNAEKDARTEFNMGDKFRFVRDRVLAENDIVAAAIVKFKEVHVKQVEALREDEVVVYIYLFNAQGLSIDTWRKAINTEALYDHSVNRPIYPSKADIDSFINRKMNKVQHAYLSIAVKKENILPSQSALKDSYDHPLIKVREGAFVLKKLISFTHNGVEYEVTEEGGLAKKLS